MTAAVRASFEAQAAACAELGSPLTARVLRLLARDMALGGSVADRVLGWQGDLSRSGDALALRLAGGLHAVVLAGEDPGLAAFYARPEALDDAETGAPSGAGALLCGALRDHAARLHLWLDNPPQTNEVRRSAALIAAGHWLTDRIGLPLVLSELGASAGLNLHWDRYGLQLARAYGPAEARVVLSPDWQGPLPPQTPPLVAERAGVDLIPLDPVADRLRILSYIWADQADRLARSRNALDLAAAQPVALAQGDAVDWLEQRLARPHPGRLHLVYHTIAWQYFPPQSQRRGEALLAQAGARASAAAPLARLSMEADAQHDGAALRLQVWRGAGEERYDLARVDFHGRWLRWLV